MHLKRIAKIFTLIFFLLSASSGFSQDYPEIDSLKALLKNVSSEEKVEVLNELSKAYFGISPEKILEFGNQALELSEKLDYKKGIAQAFNRIGSGYFYLSNYNKSLEHYMKSLEIYEDICDKYGIASSLINIGNIYWEFTNYEKSLEYYLKSLKIYREIGNKIGIVSSLINIGNVCIKLRNYDKASLYIEQSLKLAEEIEAKEGDFY